MTVQAFVFPVEHFGMVVCDIGFPKVGRRGRCGRHSEETIWYSLVMLAVRTGAADRLVHEFDGILDSWCEAYKQAHGVTRTPEAIRTALCAMRKTVYFKIPLVDEYGRVRSKAEILRDYRKLPIQQVPRKPRKRAPY